MFNFYFRYKIRKELQKQLKNFPPIRWKITLKVAKSLQNKAGKNKLCYAVVAHIPKREEHIITIALFTWFLFPEERTDTIRHELLHCYIKERYGISYPHWHPIWMRWARELGVKL